MKPQRKQILDTFEEHVYFKFKKHCERHQLTFEIKSLITFLIDFEIISDKTVLYHVIVYEFEELYRQEKFQKTKTVAKLANRFNISERSIWNILKKAKIESRKTQTLG